MDDDLRQLAVALYGHSVAVADAANTVFAAYPMNSRAGRSMANGINDVVGVAHRVMELGDCREAQGSAPTAAAAALKLHKAQRGHERRTQPLPAEIVAALSAYLRERVQLMERVLAISAARNERALTGHATALRRRALIVLEVLDGDAPSPAA